MDGVHQSSSTASISQQAATVTNTATATPQLPAGASSIMTTQAECGAHMQKNGSQTVSLLASNTSKGNSQVHNIITTCYLHIQLSYVSDS